MTIDWSRWPTRVRFKINKDKLFKKVGGRVASGVKRRIKKGEGADGMSLPPPQSATNPPLMRTKKLWRSIKYDRRLKEVIPSTKRREDVSRRARSNFGLMRILIVQRDIDPMGVDSGLEKTMSTASQKEIKRQINSGEGGLITELKGRLRSRGRRR